MNKKLPKKEIVEIFKKQSFEIQNMEFIKGIDVYHIHEWDHGYEGHTGYCGSRREFYQDYSVMQNFLRKYVDKNAITEFIIAPFHLGYYFNGISEAAYDIYNEINDFLQKNKIDKRYESGLKFDVETNWSIIDAICEGGYRNISNICLMSEEDSTIIVPWHHMNIYFYASDFEAKKIQINEIVEEYCDVNVFLRD